MESGRPATAGIAEPGTVASLLIEVGTRTLFPAIGLLVGSARVAGELLAPRGPAAQAGELRPASITFFTASRGG